MSFADRRTSGRARKPTEKAAGLVTFEQLQELDNEDDRATPAPISGIPGVDDVPEDDEFFAPEEDQADSASEDAEAHDLIDSDAEDAEDAPHESEIDEDEFDEIHRVHGQGLPSQLKGLSGFQYASSPASKPRLARGITQAKSRGTKRGIQEYFFGPDKADREPAIQHNYRWRKETTLPSRKADLSGAGGYHRSFYLKDADRLREMEEDWKWYDEQGGKDTFLSQQKIENLDPDMRKQYSPLQKRHLEVVMGPMNAQRVHDIPLLSTFDLNNAFPTESLQITKRSGWLLNAGGRVQDLGWAPNRPTSNQILAIITTSDFDDRSAFHPRTPQKSAIQIWQVKVTSEGRVDQSQAPQLRQTLCFDFGEVKSIKWCMAPRRAGSGPESERCLGLLAGIFGDGSLRVLDVSLPPDDASAQHLHITSTAFTAKPPSTVFSCVAWLSSHGLAAGTADGIVAVFDLPATLKSADTPFNADPVIYSQLQSTFIVSLLTCYPSRPHMLVSSSMSGQISLTDLTRVSTHPGFSSANTVYSQRTRLGRTVVAWHDWSQTVLTVDDHHGLQGLPLRRFYGSTGLSRFHSASVALGVSECHPCIVAAGVGGEATFTNPIRRILNGKEKIWNLRWFLHTWRRRVMPDLGTDAMTEPADQPQRVVEARSVDPPSKAHDTVMANVRASAGEQVNEVGEMGGLVRIVEGFRAEEISLFNQSSSGKGKGKAGIPGGVIHTTIHEAQTAVTTVSWNPNLHVGGWVAAGMASGLVRIEDVGIEK